MRLCVSPAGLALALALCSTVAAAADPAPLVRFSGAIGVDPLTAAGGVDVTNTVRGIAPGGRAWTLRQLNTVVSADGRIVANGKGLLFTSGEFIGTRGPVANVVATLACGPADATARRFNSPPAPLDLAGDFRIVGRLSEDGINPAVMPPTCDNPVLLIRAFNAAAGTAGGWFAAGIPAFGDD